MDIMKNSVFLYAGKGEKARLLDFKVGQGAQRDFQFISLARWAASRF